jgi:hypothetical protein
MKLRITKAQNGGYLIKDVKTKAISVVSSHDGDTEKQHADLGKVVAGLVDGWYEKGDDKVVSMDDEDEERGVSRRDDDDDDDADAGDFVAALANEFLKVAKKIPSRHRRANKEEDSG